VQRAAKGYRQPQLSNVLFIIHSIRRVCDKFPQPCPSQTRYSVRPIGTCKLQLLASAFLVHQRSSKRQTIKSTGLLDIPVPLDAIKNTSSGVIPEAANSSLERLIGPRFQAELPRRVVLDDATPGDSELSIQLHIGGDWRVSRCGLSNPKLTSTGLKDRRFAR
jgi:hypothetical protein